MRVNSFMKYLFRRGMLLPCASSLNTAQELYEATYANSHVLNDRFLHFGTNAVTGFSVATGRSLDPARHWRLA